MAGRLSGRTALITGASRGIGLGIARQFAHEGADLMLVARNEKTLRDAKSDLARYDVRVATHVLDVSDRGACFDAIDRTVRDFGSLQILVNNAAIYFPRAFLDYTAEDFHRMQDVNLYGVIHLMQAALPYMLDQGYGKVVNVASTAGKWASRNQSAYNVAKHGVVALTRCVALEMAARGITVNAICPGLVQTDLVEEFCQQHAALDAVSAATVRQSLLGRIPQGRFLDIDECGHLAVYLASAESDGMTGQSLLLDGGMLYV